MRPALPGSGASAASISCARPLTLGLLALGIRVSKGLGGFHFRAERGFGVWCPNFLEAWFFGGQCTGSSVFWASRPGPKHLWVEVRHCRFKGFGMYGFRHKRNALNIKLSNPKPCTLHNPKPKTVSTPTPFSTKKSS